MKSIQNQYRDLREGKMSQQNFMRNLRMTMPQYVTNVTSFGDAVKILKNKSIIAESHAGNDQWLDAFQDALGFKTYMSPSYLIGQYGDIKPEDAARKFMDDSTESAMAKDKEKFAKETGLNEATLNEFGGESDSPDNPKLQAAAKYLVQNRDRYLTQDYWTKHGIRMLSVKSDEELYDYLVNKIHSDAVYDSVAHMKAGLNEAVLGENNLLDELESEMEDGNSYAEAIAKVAAKYNMNEDELATKYPEEAVGNKAYADNYDEPVDDSDVDWTNENDDEFDSMISSIEDENASEEAAMSQYDLGEELNKAKIKVPIIVKAEKDPKSIYQGLMGRTLLTLSNGDTVSVRNGELDGIYGIDSEGDLNDFVGQQWDQLPYFDVDKNSFEDIDDEPLTEGKGKELHPNQIHPQELRMGIKVELEHTDVLDKAKKIALDHLAENPFYYTALKLAGVESPSAPKAKAPKETKEKKKKEAIQLVDLVNGMKKVKMPKAEEKKKIKEARFNVIGEPNEVAKQVMQFVDGNDTLKALSNDIEIQQTSDPNEALLRFQYWDALPSEAVQKLKLQFNVEKDSDSDEDTGEIIFYRLTPLRRNYGSKDLGASFEKFKSQLQEIVREVLSEMQSDDQEIDDMAMSMDETFDGRDNLTDITDDTK